MCRGTWGVNDELLHDLLIPLDLIYHILSLLKLLLESLARFFDLLLLFSDPFLKFKFFAFIRSRGQLLSFELLLKQMFFCLFLLLDDLFANVKHFWEVLEVKLLHEMWVGFFQVLEGVPLE